MFQRLLNRGVMLNILDMTALELSRAIKNKDLNCVDVVNLLFDEIERKDKKINAYISLSKENALKRAEEVQKLIECGELDSPLAGVPIAIKDNICTKGLKTTCASKMLENFVPVYNATVIDRLEKAGAIIIGKLNMDEFAMGSTGETSYFGATFNPHDTNRVAGGSSSGAAASVASKESFLSLGSDTGGSVRQPAAYCGVTGFKPTYGTVSRYGLVAYASSLDQIGPVGKDVADCAAITDIIRGKDPLDSTTLDVDNNLLDSLNGDINGMKIAIPRECLSESLQPDVKARILDVSDKLKELGAIVEYIDLPILDYLIPTYYIIASAEASSNLSRYDGVKYGYRNENTDSVADLYIKSRSEGFGKEVKKRILLGTFVLSSGYFDAYYRKALKAKAIIKNEFDKVFEDYDAILTPTAPNTAPIIEESLSDPLKMYLSDIFTVFANLAGLPALSIPCGLSNEGLPIGAQIVGQRMNDDKVLNIGFAYQKATDFHKTIAEVKL